jgi:glutathione S-transferase
MIILYAFGPYFGLPDASPFVMKAETLLKLAGLEHATVVGGFVNAPKGKLPYLRDGDEVIADSTFIRLHIERKYGFDFDQGLSDAEKGVAWAIEKMCEDHLYWLVVDARWLDKANFARGPALFFLGVPTLTRPLVKALVRRSVKRTLRGQGLGRHTAEERAELARRDLAAIDATLGDKPFLFGDAPRGVDATVGAFVAACLAKAFVAPLREAAEAKPRLVAYAERMIARFYPDFAR